MAKKTPAGNLTTAEIQTSTDRVVTLRQMLRANGVTVLTATPEWTALRKELVTLNKSLLADAAAKREALELAV